MPFSQHRNLAIVFSLCLVLSMIAASTTLLPSTSAHTPSWQIPTFAYCMAAPNPVGVGQTVYVYVWLNVPFEGAAIINNYRFHNYQINVTAPNGQTNTTTYATVQDTTSSQYFAFTPDQVGTWKFNFTFPGQNINDYPHANDAFVNDTYLPSSASTTLVVQQD